MGTKKIVIIAAVADNLVIGDHGDIPWKLRTDLSRFYSITKNKTVIMGGETMRSILKRNGEPLTDRKNIVITRHPNDWRLWPEVVIAKSPEEAITLAGDGEVFICGGAQIYSAFIGIADEIMLSEVNVLPTGDAFFPNWDPFQWEETYCKLFPATDEDRYPHFFRKLKRKNFCETVNARNAEQLGVMEKINAAGYCPFCTENLKKNHKKPIIFEGDHWIATENQWPYSAAASHILIISKTHTEKMSDIPPGAGEELTSICRLLEEKYDVKSGAVCMRFGVPVLNGGTVNHLHAHFLVPDPEKESSLFFWIDKRKTKKK